MNEKILTLNPDPAKKGVKIDKDRYENMRSVILEILKANGPLSSSKLVEAVVATIEANGKVDYSVGWCAMAVKLDLEARSEICYDRSVKKPVVTLSNS